MSKYWNDGFYSQPSALELKWKSNASRKNAEKKGKILEPVIIQGRTAAKSWWGRAWCANLERYADFESCLERGRQYVRTGAVIDLKIGKGRVQARVQGSRKTHYKVDIRISPLFEERCQEIIRKCGQRVENLEKLLTGDFPAELGDCLEYSNRGRCAHFSKE